MMLLSLTSMPPQGETPAQEAVPGAPQAADAGNRFAGVLARRLSAGGKAPQDEDTLVVLEPNALAASACLSAAAHAEGVGVAPAWQQDCAGQQDADAAADAALSRANASGVRLDAGRALGLAPRLRGGQVADGRKPDALRGDAPSEDAGDTNDALEPSSKFLDGVDVTDSPDVVAGVLKHIQTANRLTAQGRAYAGIRADAPSSATALSIAPAAHADVDAALLAPAADVGGHGAANQNNSGASLLTPLTPAASADSPVLAAGARGIDVPLAHPQWPQALGQQVLHLSRASHDAPQAAQLSLNPAELGPLRIAIELHQHVAHAAFVSAHASVRLAVENALPQLQEQLAQAGISLGQASVSDQPSSQQNAPAHAQSASEQEALRLVAELDPQYAAPGTPPVVRNPHALIDTFA